MSKYKKISDENEPSLFKPPESAIPLAERVRPKTISEIVGQDHLLGKDGVVSKMINSGSIRSMIFWGPPGTGKTTLAQILANEVKAKIFSNKCHFFGS